MTLLVAAIGITVLAVCLGEALGPDMAGWADGAWRQWRDRQQNQAHLLSGRDL